MAFAVREDPPSWAAHVSGCYLENVTVCMATASSKEQMLPAWVHGQAVPKQKNMDQERPATLGSHV